MTTTTNIFRLLRHTAQILHVSRLTILLWTLSRITRLTTNYDQQARQCNGPLLLSTTTKQHLPLD